MRRCHGARLLRRIQRAQHWPAIRIGRCPSTSPVTWWRVSPPADGEPCRGRLKTGWSSPQTLRHHGASARSAHVRRSDGRIMDDAPAEQAALAGQLQPVLAGPVGQLADQLLLGRRELRLRPAARSSSCQSLGVSSITLSYTVEITLPR